MPRANSTVLWALVGLLVTVAAACSGANTTNETTAPVSIAAPVSTSQQAVATTTSTAKSAPSSSSAFSANAADDEEHATEDVSSGEGHSAETDEERTEGLSEEDGDERKVEAPENSEEQIGEHDAGQLGGGNIFTTGTPEQQACLRNALGDIAFEAIASGARTPTEIDNRAMNPCVGSGPDNGGNETASQPPQIPPDDGGNVFTTGTPEQQACLRNALGDIAFEAIASGARTPTEIDNRAMNPCVGSGPDNGGNETASQPPQIPPDDGGAASPPDPPAGGGGGGFTSLPPGTQACLSNSLGVSAYEAIISGSVAPTTAQNTVMDESCGYAGFGPSANLAIADYPLPDAPTPPSRSYLAEIHSIGEPRFARMKGLLAAPGYIDNLLKEGFNTWSIYVTYLIDSDGAISWNGMGDLTQVVSLARQGGLAVRLTPVNFQDLFMDDTPKANREALYDNRLSAALELASLAERFKVEYFTPIGEAEGQLDNSAFGDSFETDAHLEPISQILDPEGDPALTARSALMSTWLETMAPELRGVFSGRLVAHFGTAHPRNLVPSYDLVGVTLSHSGVTDLDTFRTFTTASLDFTSTSATRSGIPWGVVETYFYWSEIADPYTQDNVESIEPGDVAAWEDQEKVALLRDLQDDYFRIALDEYYALQSGTMFDAGGWINPGVEIGGSAAEIVLSDFFSSR